MQFVSLPKHQWIFKKAGQLQVLDLSKPQVMGILNLTPDSFSDGGQYATLAAMIDRAAQMLTDGASIIDIGGESTRPNALAVSSDAEMDRILPAVEAISKRFDCVLSIDTSSPEVFSAAHALGADVWNDVRALSRPQALATAAQLNVPVILMHSRGEPDTMNSLAHYSDVTETVITELQQRIDAALQAGICKHHIMIDAGFGFAKTATQNMQLLHEHWQLAQLGYPMMIGVSRKRFLGELLGGVPVDKRLYVGLGAAMLGVQQGASIVRTHDVAATVQVLKVLGV